MKNKSNVRKGILSEKLKQLEQASKMPQVTPSSPTDYRYNSTEGYPNPNMRNLYKENAKKINKK